MTKRKVKISLYSMLLFIRVVYCLSRYPEQTQPFVDLLQQNYIEESMAIRHRTNKTGKEQFNNDLVVVQPFYCRRNELPLLRLPHPDKKCQPSLANNCELRGGGVYASYRRLWKNKGTKKQPPDRNRVSSLLHQPRNIRKTLGSIGKLPNPQNCAADYQRNTGPTRQYSQVQQPSELIRQSNVDPQRQLHYPDQNRQRLETQKVVRSETDEVGRQSILQVNARTLDELSKHIVQRVSAVIELMQQRHHMQPQTYSRLLKKLQSKLFQALESAASRNSMFLQLFTQFRKVSKQHRSSSRQEMLMGIKRKLLILKQRSAVWITDKLHQDQENAELESYKKISLRKTINTAERLNTEPQRVARPESLDADNAKSTQRNTQNFEEQFTNTNINSLLKLLRWDNCDSQIVHFPNILIKQESNPFCIVPGQSIKELCGYQRYSRFKPILTQFDSRGLERIKQQIQFFFQFSKSNSVFNLHRRIFLNRMHEIHTSLRQLEDRESKNWAEAADLEWVKSLNWQKQQVFDISVKAREIERTNEASDRNELPLLATQASTARIKQSHQRMQSGMLLLRLQKLIGKREESLIQFDPNNAKHLPYSE